MAIFHLHVQAISRASGRSATGAAAYRAAEVVVDERTGEVFDYTRKKGVLYSEILAPKNAPDWVFNRADLWNRVEHAEKRKDAQACRELDIALPCELSSRQRLDLIRSYVKKNFVRHGMVADVCLHAPGRGENNKNFHAHVLLTMRRLEGDGFGNKARDWNAVAMLESWRANWAKEANAALAQYGHEARIDHRSNKDRGLDAVPGQHHGPAVAGILRRGEESEESEVAQRQEAERATREHAQLQAQLAIVRAQATAADAELQALEAQELAEQERVQALAEAQAKEAARVERHSLRLVAEQKAQAVQAERQRLEAQAEQAERVERERQEAQEAQEAAAAQAVQVAQAEHRRQLELVKAREAHQKAEQQLAQAVQAESAAKTAVEQLQDDRDWAVLGMQEAGKSLLKTAKALLKAPGWVSAINAYDAAVEVFEEAGRASSTARQVFVLAQGKVMELDHAERATYAAKVVAWKAQQDAWKAAQAAKTVKVRGTPALAPFQAPRALQPIPASPQVHHDPDDDDEPSRPAPGM